MSSLLQHPTRKMSPVVTVVSQIRPTEKKSPPKLDLTISFFQVQRRLEGKRTSLISDGVCTLCNLFPFHQFPRRYAGDYWLLLIPLPSIFTVGKNPLAFRRGLVSISCDIIARGQSLLVFLATCSLQLARAWPTAT